MNCHGKRILAWSLALAVSIVLLSLLAPASGFTRKARAAVGKPSGNPLLSGLGRTVVHWHPVAAGTATRQPGLSEGRELRVAYSGPPRLASVLQANKARSLALASADFDEDGIADLAAAYRPLSAAGPQGPKGIIAIHRGNPDSIYQNSPDAQKRRAEGLATDSPFLSPAALFELPISPDLIGTGDFNDDGHADIVAAQRGVSALYVMPGDGQGGFGQPVRIDLPGAATAMAVGDINRRDGFADIVVAITGSTGPSLLMFEDPRGAVKASPEVITLPSAAASIAIGRAPGEPFADISVACGSKLVIVPGRDRKLLSPEAIRTRVHAPTVLTSELGVAATAVVTGDFTGRGGSDIAALGADGSVRILRRPTVEDARVMDASTAIASGASQMPVGVGQIAAQPGSIGGGRLVKGTVWGGHDDLIVADSENSKIILLDSAGAQQANANSFLDVDGSPADILPMRLNSDGRSSLVILRGSSITPAVMTTQSSQVLTVTTTADAGPGSLRQAILDANTSGGPAGINFAIPGTGPFSIFPLTPLPQIRATVTLDATTQPGFAGAPVVELNGSALPDQSNGLSLGQLGEGSVVRGLAIDDFARVNSLFPSFAGIHASADPTRGGFIIEGNYVGVGTSGLAPFGNDSAPGPGNGIGIAVDNTVSVVIGGTNPAARNVVAGNHLIGVLGDHIDGLFIFGNFIGVDATGEMPFGNGVGLFIDQAPGTVGGNAGMRNIISGNRGPGVQLDCGLAGNTVVIQNNYIGTDAAGAEPIPNRGPGIIITGLDGSTIGGAGPAGNLISGNAGDGIDLESQVSDTSPAGEDPIGCRSFPTRDITIMGNLIGTDASGTLPLGNQGNGILIGGLPASDLGSPVALPSDNLIRGNVIAFNGLSGVELPTTPDVLFQVNNDIRSNLIFSNARLGIDLGDPGVTPNPFDLLDGPNHLQNFPQLNSPTVNSSSRVAATHAGLAPADAAPTTTVSGILTAKASTVYTLEFFFGADCPASGHQFLGTIPVLMGTLTVTTDSGGNAPYSSSFPLPDLPVPTGFINATATDPSGNTSEFSECTAVSLPCNFSLSPAAKLLDAGGGAFSVSVLNSNNCPWSATSNVPWITIASGATGTGNGSVALIADPNPGGFPRSGSVTIAGVAFAVTEDGQVCQFSINPSSASFPPGGGSVTLSVQTPDGCAWSAASNVPWITVASGSAGTGNGSVTLAADPNPGPGPRSGTVTIAGLVFTASEDGPCAFSINPSAQLLAADGGSGSIQVTAGAGCTWTAVSNAGFITIASGSSGSGSGTVGFQVTANSSATSRSGTLTVAGQTFTVTEAGLPIITEATLAGKDVVVTGQNFAAGAIMLVNGTPQNTLQDRQNLNTLTGKKSAKGIAAGTLLTLQVRNPDGSVSQTFLFTR